SSIHCIRRIKGWLAECPPNSIKVKGHISRTSKINGTLKNFARYCAAKLPIGEGDEYKTTSGFCRLEFLKPFNVQANLNQFNTLCLLCASAYSGRFIHTKEKLGIISSIKYFSENCFGFLKRWL